MLDYDAQVDKGASEVIQVVIPTLNHHCMVNPDTYLIAQQELLQALKEGKFDRYTPKDLAVWDIMAIPIRRHAEFDFGRLSVAAELLKHVSYVVADRYARNFRERLPSQRFAA